jgi:hypothetical protein
MTEPVDDAVHVPRSARRDEDVVGALVDWMRGDMRHVDAFSMEAGEKHFARAKDASKLCAAIDAKIDAQADYIVWRDGVVSPPRRKGKTQESIAVLRSTLPDAGVYGDRSVTEAMRLLYRERLAEDRERRRTKRQAGRV